MASLFKRRSTAVSSDLKRLSESETTLAQSRFNVEKITEIQNRFAGGEMLLVPGRIFIREGTMFKSCRKGLKKRQFFLFNDILVYGSIVAKGRYSNQHVLYLSHMTVDAECSYTALAAAYRAADPGLESENAFQLNHSEKSFHVIAQSRADKSNWITNLDKQIKKITNESSGDQPVMKAVWIPDSVCKECPLCQQKFNAFIRKHHCRMCGRVVCSSCSPHKADISRLRGGESTGRLERVCTVCYKSTCGKVNSKEEEEDSRGPSGSEGACRSVHVSWMQGREHVAIHQRVEYVGNNVSLSTIAEQQRVPDTRQQDHSSRGEQPANRQQSADSRVQLDGRAEDNLMNDSSSDTEDSDDSSIEATPIPPPRRKKLQHILQKQIASRQAQQIPSVTSIEAAVDETDGDNRTAQQVTEDATAQEVSEEKEDRHVQLDSVDKEDGIPQRLSVEITPQQLIEDEQVSEDKEGSEQKDETVNEESAVPIPRRRKQKLIQPTSEETTPTTVEATPTNVETTSATDATETTPIPNIKTTPPITAARLTDVAPRSARSPSAHVRLRKSKFTSSTNTS